ncbi:UDP-N-acetylmuramoyl-tripeptide--D-alanyl-D-alanine ligase [Peribacillus loiseleuriae]|uniref:UDP-N-acetylmuramoyl-tripeptide--D-alanyl-D-alanine ligase n=1 Tax=Peribacillus loiseleuriae TaxID=1679170 RepID=A0A0K9GPY1_9BACI|nr:UDP-N-acetylmuramoyl-tripeptide--D-alanyl-D-alanine ligase [Peribacillus loiseleuriae]KMY48322.1 UDP-N-acetylmuramoyl-tripeptide--D-alanyl-D-alanine ligase [Peribacillus loiseleuriae]
MLKKTLKQIHEMVDGLNIITDFESIIAAGVSIDSRNIEFNNLFIPLSGEHVDGHQYVEKAISQGAAASLWQQDAGEPPAGLPVILVENTEKALQKLASAYRKQLNCKVIGVTGSNGKTTTKDMIAALLQTTYRIHKTSGNFNNHLGLPLTILGIGEDTEVAVLEMGMSNRGEIAFLSTLAEPDLAIITNVGESHLLDLGSREEIANAKLEIVSGLKAGGTLIYQGDEPLLRDRIERDLTNLHVVSFGRENKNDLYPISITQNDNSTSFEINGDSGDPYMIPILGFHNVQNALAAMLVAKLLRVNDANIRKGFESVRLTNMRMEMVEGAKGEKIINDAYNASPTSMKAAIELIESLSGFQAKYLVLGDMLELGNQEKDYHVNIGEIIQPDEIDTVFTYGPLGHFIAEGARQSFPADRVFSYDDKSALIADLKQRTSLNDLILVKASRGMKLEEIVQALQK